MSIGLQPVETMNENDQIRVETKLYGLIAEHASPNRLFVTVNRRIKADGIDAMMIPMNIRQDDIYFTLANMKKSHVNGAYIAQEYQEAAVELLDDSDEFVEVYGRCDFVFREGERLIGTYVEKNGTVTGEALADAVYELIKRGEL